jgi:hypothetical protein
MAVRSWPYVEDEEEEDGGDKDGQHTAKIAQGEQEAARRKTATAD